MNTIEKNRNKAWPQLKSGLIITLALLVVITVACSDNQPMDQGDAKGSDEILQSRGAGMNSNFVHTDAGLLRDVIQATARYHSTRQAERDGYEVASQCVVSTTGAGAMGYHWLNRLLVDPVFDTMKPEALLYEPDKNGNLKLVAIEYIVVDIGQDRPYFGDHPFDIGGTPMPFPHWSLHVWLWKNNPAGMFTPYNPDVTCP